MKELMSSAANFYLVPHGAKPDGRPFRPMVEVVLVVSEPQYTFDAAGHSVRQRTTGMLRFHTTPNGLRALVQTFGEWADEAEKMAPDDEGE